MGKLDLKQAATCTKCINHWSTSSWFSIWNTNKIYVCLISLVQNFIRFFSCYDQCIPCQLKHFACWKPNCVDVTSIYVYGVPSNLCLMFRTFTRMFCFVFCAKTLSALWNMVPSFSSATMTRFWFASSTLIKVQRMLNMLMGTIDWWGKSTWHLRLELLPWWILSQPSVSLVEVVTISIKHI